MGGRKTDPGESWGGNGSKRGDIRESESILWGEYGSHLLIPKSLEIVAEHNIEIQGIFARR